MDMKRQINMWFFNVNVIYIKKINKSLYFSNLFI
jgi:hypothetical protein